MLKLQFQENPSRGIWLVGENLRIGSDSENDVVLDGLGVQSLHAEIAINGDELSLKSLTAGSCYVNDAPVDSIYSLKVGDELRIGKDRLLIVDPKQQLDSTDSSDMTGRVAQAKNQMAETTGWTLKPLNEKLKSRQFPINGNCIIGRSKDVALSVPYKLLSREHAEFSIVNDQLHIQDLGSANGCFVNGERVTEARLKGGETLSFAKLAFTVVAPMVTTKVVVEEDTINKTMIRPAISLDSAKKAAAMASQKPQLDAVMAANQTTAEPEADSSISSSKWSIVIVLMVVVAITAGAWLML